VDDLERIVKAMSPEAAGAARGATGTAGRDDEKSTDE
jgi:hypothetical protein